MVASQAQSLSALSSRQKQSTQGWQNSTGSKFCFGAPASLYGVSSICLTIDFVHHFGRLQKTNKKTTEEFRRESILDIFSSGKVEAILTYSPCC